MARAWRQTTRKQRRKYVGYSVNNQILEHNFVSKENYYLNQNTEDSIRSLLTRKKYFTNFE